MRAPNMECLSLPEQLCGYYIRNEEHPIQTAVKECMDAAETWQRLVGQGQETESRALQLVEEEPQVTERGILKDALNTLPATYQRLQRRHQQAKEAAQLWEEIADTAQRCVHPTDGLLASLEEASKVLEPADRMEEDARDDNNNQVEQEDRALLEFCEVERDLEMVEECTRQVEQSRFTSPTAPGVTSRGPVLNSIRAQQDKIQALFAKIGQMASKLFSWAQEMLSGGCCARMAAMAKALYECLRHAKMIQKLAQALRRLVQAVRNFMQKSTKTLASLLVEFPAAKKVGNFMKQHVGPRIRKLVHNVIK